MRETLILIITLLLSLIIGITAGENIDERIVSTNEIHDFFNQPREIHEPKHGSGWLIKQGEDNISQIHEANESGWVDYWGTPPFKVRTDSKGLRNTEIPREKSENTTRVLILGDSFTFGHGVNKSDTYPEVAEDRINSELRSQEIQVINGGVSGYGMKDQYILLKERGLEYQPDIIVSTINRNDWRSMSNVSEMRHLANKKIEENFNLTDFNLEDRNINETVYEKANEAYYDIIWSRYENIEMANSSLRYMDRINQIAENRNITLIYFQVNELPIRVKEFVKEKAEKQNRTFGSVSREFINNRDRYSISPWDGHPNAEGYQIIGEDLSNILKKELN